MANPYRILTELAPELPPELPEPPSMDVAVVLGVNWIAALIRVLFGLCDALHDTADLPYAWLVVLLLPVLIWKEAAAVWGNSVTPRDRGEEPS